MAPQYFVLISIALFALVHSQTAESIQAVPFVNTDNHGYQADGSMDMTFAKSTQQKNEFIENAGKVQPGTNFLQHLFQTDGDDEFHFTLPVEQQIAIYAYSYVAEENTFVRVKNLEAQQPVKLSIYEDRNMIVKSNFYFQKYIVLNGKKDTKYLIKFETSGKNKLISLSVKLFVEQADIKKNMLKDEVMKHSVRTSNMKTELAQISNRFGVLWVINENNLRHSIMNVRRYYVFELVQMLLVGVVSYFQIRILFKLLKRSSIIV